MNETQSNPSCADDELDLRELFRFLKGKSIIALFTGLAAFLSLTVALSIPNSYQSISFGTQIARRRGQPLALRRSMVAWQA